VLALGESVGAPVTAGSLAGGIAHRPRADVSTSARTLLLLKWPFSDMPAYRQTGKR
jgi:hypothetical protein